MPGYPDVAWWAAQGLSAPYLATSYDYGSDGYPPSPLRLLGLLEECKARAEEDGGVFLEAWKRQRAQVEGMSLQVASAHSLQDQRGKGILPGEFIKPDPTLTRQETRAYLLAELDRYMEGIILSDAGLILSEGLQESAVADEVAEGVWPAARLFMLYCGLRLTGKLGPSMTFRDIARWAVSVIRGQLAGEPAVDPLEIMALGFWTVDRFLPAGRTIGSFWDHSPFEALRNAPPLTEAADEDEDEYADMPPLMDLSGNLLDASGNVLGFPAGGPMTDLSGNVLAPMTDLSGNVLEFPPMTDLSGNVLDFPPMMDLSGNVLDFPAASPLPVSDGDDDDDDPDDSDYDPEEDEEESESESEYDSDDAEEVDEDEDEEDEEVEEIDTETHYAPSFTPFPAFATEEVDFPSFLRQEVTLKCNVPVGALVAVFFTAFFYVTVAAIASQRR